MSRSIEKYLSNTCIVFDEQMGERFRTIRYQMKLSQTEFAEKFGASQITISRLELAKTKYCPFSTGHVKSIVGKYFDYLLTGEWIIKGQTFQPHRELSNLEYELD